MKYTTVIFDFDGTLVDTLEDLHLSVAATLKHFGLPGATFEQTRTRVGNGINRLLELSLPEDATPELFAEVRAWFTAYYDEHSADHAFPYEGIPAMLEKLYAAGVHMAVVSNKDDAVVRALMAKTIEVPFDVIMGCQEGIERKPARAMVDEALRRMGEGAVAAAAADRAVYVGDSEVDLLTAANSELPCISVSWGFRKAEELRAAGATTLVDSAEELYCALEGVKPNSC